MSDLLQRGANCRHITNSIAKKGKARHADSARAGDGFPRDAGAAAAAGTFSSRRWPSLTSFLPPSREEQSLVAQGKEK